MTLATFNDGLARLPHLDALLGEPVRHVRLWQFSGRPSGVLGWGASMFATRARWVARRLGIPFIALEDGFLRSLLPGRSSPPLSLVIDPLGMHYNANHPSALEAMLEKEGTPADPTLLGEAVHARDLIVRYGLSKYNHAPSLQRWRATQGRPLLRRGDRHRILVVDQTAGDRSIRLGGATAHDFQHMLQAALEEHPEATVYVKTHPETSAGHKRGHFSRLSDSARTVVLREPIEPMSLMREVDQVFVVTSTMGFEALLAGKPVTCFGTPWYAGWCATADRRPVARRTRHHTVDELFAAAYLRYTHYLNPYTHERGTIFDVIGWLVRQRQTAGLVYHGRLR